MTPGWPRRRWGATGLGTVTMLAMLAAGWPVHGQGAAAEQSIDDPKVARRLKTRAAAPPAAVGVAPVSAPVVPNAARAVAPSSGSLSDPAPSLRPTPAAFSTPIVETPAPTGEDGIARQVPPPSSSEDSSPKVPRLKLGYRRFSFVRIGATSAGAGASTGAAASEPFNVVSLDLYPVSNVVRFGLSTQYGAESGKFNGGGDYFVAQTFSLGVQIPGDVVTPFAEGFAGGGYMRRMQFGSGVPTAYWHYGIDVGAEFFLSKFALLSLAVGYMHPVNGFTKELGFTSVYVDTWSLKFGIGL